MLKHFDYTVAGDVANAEYIDANGIFVGNHQYELTNQLQYLHDVIAELAS